MKISTTALLLLLVASPAFAMGPPSSRAGGYGNIGEGYGGRAMNHSGGQCNGCGTRQTGFTIESGRWSGSIGITGGGITYEGSRITRSYENPHTGLTARGERCVCSQRDRDRENFGRDLGGSDRDHSGGS